jgi:hypothetical protein
MKEHPAPWKFAWPRATAKVFDADGRMVVVVSSGTIQGAYDTDDIFATGEAIAALPELLEACKAVLEDKGANPSFGVLDKIQAAIVKAEGES